MDEIIDLVDDFLGAVMALAGGVTSALGQTGSLVLVATGTIGLFWIAGRTLKV